MENDINKEKEITIVYVFGPKEYYEDYSNGKEVCWVKIGLAHKNKNEDSKKKH